MSLESRGFSRPSLPSPPSTPPFTPGRRHQRVSPLRYDVCDQDGRQDSELGSRHTVPRLKRTNTLERFCTQHGTEKSEQRFAEKYAEVQMMGSGAFSIVRQVRCRRTGRMYAAKSIQTVSESWYHRGGSGHEVQLKNGKFSSCRTLEEVRQECQIMYELKDNASVVDVVDTSIEAGKVTIVMELLKGGSLNHIANKAPGGILEDRLRLLFHHFISALSKVHQAGIIHRDIKLENLMLGVASDMSSLKIIDVGLAVKCPSCSLQFVDSNHKGTMSYMAPEVALQRAPVVVYETANDMWACGIALLEALTGTRSPFVPGLDTPWWDKNKQKLWRCAVSAPFVSSQTTPRSPRRSFQQPRSELQLSASFDSVICLDPAVHKELQAYVNKQVEQWLADSKQKVSNDLKAFIRRLMQVHPAQRMTAAAALADPWFSDARLHFSEDQGSRVWTSSMSSSFRGSSPTQDDGPQEHRPSRPGSSCCGLWGLFCGPVKYEAPVHSITVGSR
ncbi:hypothetical protein CYMTET_12279 [Cymbomonas tetramitiformis]|uniref:Protein kinase domain-containing protein n=1 Tax=Cymbomonas tetramitiformis TaxID=36881 RepID=A0AAE0GKR6_9CHLO|nr:hypothetical protein CYMTET_12279 [Cymbomonas tetramitiformis]